MKRIATFIFGLSMAAAMSAHSASTTNYGILGNAGDYTFSTTGSSGNPYYASIGLFDITNGNALLASNSGTSGVNLASLSPVSLAAGDYAVVVSEHASIFTSGVLGVTGGRLEIGETYTAAVTEAGLGLLGTGSITRNNGESPLDDEVYVLYFSIIPALNVADLNQAFRVHHLIPRLASLTINGAHHRLLVDSPVGENGWHTWVTGDYADIDDVDSTQYTGEIGASRDIFENFRLGLGIGSTDVEQDTAFGGNSDIEGEFAVLEANYITPWDGLVLSALVYYGDYDVKTTRGYSSDPGFSRGSTDATNTAFRLRADWKDLTSLGEWSVTPRLAYTLIHAEADGFTETGGLTPATFGSQDSVDHEIRLGVDFDYEINDKAAVRLMTEAVYRESDVDTLYGTAVMTPFALANEDFDDLWVRAGAELVYEVCDSAAIHASVFGSTEGYDGTVGGSIGLQVGF